MADRILSVDSVTRLPPSYGAGGAGGGASLNGNNSGAGGAGGPGYVLVVSHF